MFNPRFLLISLGNPAPYHDSFHSAGHLALSAFQRFLSPSQPSFSSERHAKKAVLASIGLKYRMIQSPAVMNVSGGWVAQAWKEHYNGSPKEFALVIVHDDLELALGAVKMRDWNQSHKGHNGVKSVSEKLNYRTWGQCKWARISIGIGRPERRDRETVSNYVLRNMSEQEKSVIENEAPQRMLEVLQEMEREWVAEVEEVSKQA